MAPGPGSELDARRRLARVPIDQPAGLTGRLVGWLSRKLYGQAADNGFAMAHNRKVLLATLFHERRVAKFDRLDPSLKRLADHGGGGRDRLLLVHRLRLLPRRRRRSRPRQAGQRVSHWREAENLSPLEKQVIAYADGRDRDPESRRPTRWSRRCGMRSVTRRWWS